MPSLSYQLVQRATLDSTTTAAASRAYPSAILLAFFSFLLMLLILPPMIWHFRNRNIGATALVVWTAILLLFNFINAILWSNDNISTWYNGVGLCDFEVKIQIASEVARPASLACILRALAAVLNTDRATLMKTKAQRRRNCITDLSWCLGIPLLQMLFHYIVQSSRYFVFGISGCVPEASNTLVTLFLLGMPPLIWILIASYYAVLILIRLYRYRLTFNSILANSDTTKSRFMRLYIICIVLIIGYIPAECYVLYYNLNDLVHEPYSWSSTHDPQKWNEIIMVPSNGMFDYTRWIWLSCGFIVFVFFGFGRDAVNMYRNGMLAIGLRRIFPSLRQDYRGSITVSISRYGSKAKMFFKRKSFISNSTWKSTSDASQTSSSDPISQTQEKHLDAVGALSDPEENHPLPLASTNVARMSHEDVAKPSLASRVLNHFQSKKSNGSRNTDQVPLADLTVQASTVLSVVTSGPRSPTLLEHTRSVSSEEMVKRMKIEQDSEQRR